MSVEAMAIALHHSKARGAEKLILIGIANHDGDGGAWPSITTLAKYAGCSTRRATELVTSLVKRGEITREINAGGLAYTAAYERPNLYRFVLTCPPQCDRTTSHRVPKTPPAKSRGGCEISQEAPREGSHPNHPSNQPIEISIPTQVTEPVDNSACWDKHIDGYRHLAAAHADTTKPWHCIRCGSLSEPVKTLSEIVAELRGE